MPNKITATWDAELKKAIFNELKAEFEPEQEPADRTEVFLRIAGKRNEQSQNDKNATSPGKVI